MSKDRRFSHHSYTYTPRLDWVHHDWVVHCEYGAVNFHVQIHNEGKYDACPGMEFHSRTSTGGPPSHVNCHVLKAPCWHDGTSLYAGILWNDYGLKRQLSNGNHGAILWQLETEAAKHWMKSDD